MDWSKSKSIFIIVFLILDIFLYSLYLNRYTEAQKVEVLGEKTIEARLKDDNITYAELPNIETAPYLYGSVKHFTEEDLQFLNNNEVTIENDTKIIVTLKDPIAIEDVDNPSNYVDFLQTNIIDSPSYMLWDVDETNQTVTFFQRTNNRTIYYNNHGMVKLYLNTDNEIYKYEQTLFIDLVENEEQEELWSPIQVIQLLYSKNLLKQDSSISQVKLGYSTLIQYTQTQVLVPTWEIRVKTKDDKEEEYFVNAVEGKVIELQLDQTKVEEDEE